MSVIERMEADFKAAYKNKEIAKKDYLGLLKSEVYKKSKTPSDDEVIAILQSMVKNNQKSMVENNGISSLSDMELTVIQSYLPTQMSEDKIREIIETYKANGLSNLGQIMGEFNKNFKGQADNAIVKQITQEVLA